ncbi:MAG: hypothetical protein U9R60_01835 [Bacteroidota bacterium]|nr:hypothetical protein [Bacteroidota bacterium]
MLSKRPFFVAKDLALELFDGNIQDFKKFHLDKLNEQSLDESYEEGENLDEI